MSKRDQNWRQRKKRNAESVATSSWQPIQPRLNGEGLRNKDWNDRVSPPTRRPVYHQQRVDRGSPPRKDYQTFKSRPFTSRQDIDGEHHLNSGYNSHRYEREKIQPLGFKRQRYQEKGDNRRLEDHNFQNHRLYEVKNREGKKLLYREKPESNSKSKEERMEHQKEPHSGTARDVISGAAVTTSKENSLDSTQEKELEGTDFSTQVPETFVEDQGKDLIMSKEDIDNDDLMDDQEQPSLERTISDPSQPASPSEILSTKKTRDPGASKVRKKHISSREKFSTWKDRLSKICSPKRYSSKDTF